ncbi:hypothetical protein BN2476_720040 [Paraburkholderia piptadeniae]|uniref:Uncharacterized protein n=1 Tax=Paraburkholderia piptadeniae TaxID=1701573 RepID=A0A1N7SRA3_9BURK|nr:hypothetical protein BN2476_720040 [Paraburkholderia piptadeniae]
MHSAAAIHSLSPTPFALATVRFRKCTTSSPFMMTLSVRLVLLTVRLDGSNVLTIRILSVFDERDAASGLRLQQAFCQEKTPGTEVPGVQFDYTGARRAFYSCLYIDCESLIFRPLRIHLIREGMRPSG